MVGLLMRRPARRAECWRMAGHIVVLLIQLDPSRAAQGLSAESIQVRLIPESNWFAMQGGVLEDDWATPVRDKLDRLARVCPRPSRLEVDACGRLVRVLSADAGAEGGAAQPGTCRDQVQACLHRTRLDVAAVRRLLRAFTAQRCHKEWSLCIQVAPQIRCEFACAPLFWETGLRADAEWCSAQTLVQQRSQDIRTLTSSRCRSALSY